MIRLPVHGLNHPQSATAGIDRAFVAQTCGRVLRDARDVGHQARTVFENARIDELQGKQHLVPALLEPNQQLVQQDQLRARVDGRGAMDINRRARRPGTVA